MSLLRYTLVADGSSDRVLEPIINWVLEQHPVALHEGFRSQLADFRFSRPRPANLDARIQEALRLFPCDLLFVHRDAEGAHPSVRLDEIQRAASRAAVPSHVPVVPVTMTEAWLLVDEPAIRMAADNPHGTEDLRLPRPASIESVRDPKLVLREALIAASDLQGRHLRRFERGLPDRVQRVGRLMTRLALLRELPAFVAFEECARAAADEVYRAARG